MTTHHLRWDEKGNYAVGSSDWTMRSGLLTRECSRTTYIRTEAQLKRWSRGKTVSPSVVDAIRAKITNSQQNS